MGLIKAIKKLFSKETVSGNDKDRILTVVTLVKEATGESFVLNDTGRFYIYVNKTKEAIINLNGNAPSLKSASKEYKVSEIMSKGGSITSKNGAIFDRGFIERIINKLELTSVFIGEKQSSPMILEYNGCEIVISPQKNK